MAKPDAFGIAAILIVGIAGCGSDSDAQVTAGSTGSEQRAEETTGYTAEAATDWVEALTKVPIALDFGWDPSNFSAFIEQGGKAFTGTSTADARVQPREVALPQAKGEARLARPFGYLTTELALSDGSRIPLEFNLGPPDEAQGSAPAAAQAQSLAPPAGTRMMVLAMDNFERLSPELGYWTVVETSDGGFVVGGPRVKDRRSVEGIKTFDELVARFGR